MTYGLDQTADPILCERAACSLRLVRLSRARAAVLQLIELDERSGKLGARELAARLEAIDSDIRSEGDRLLQLSAASDGTETRH